MSYGRLIKIEHKTRLISNDFHSAPIHHMLDILLDYVLRVGYKMLKITSDHKTLAKRKLCETARCTQRTIFIIIDLRV